MENDTFSDFCPEVVQNVVFEMKNDTLNDFSNPLGASRAASKRTATSFQ